jgi:hypothetical protein
VAAGSLPPAAAARFIAFFFSEYHPAGDLLLSGSEVMELLGCSQGPEVGAALAKLRAAEAAGRVTTAAEARELLGKSS